MDDWGVGELPSASFAVPAPREGERPAVYADRVGEWYAASKSDRHRKEHGLFLTPVPVAEFMAGWIKAGGRKLRILDPAAGAGVLGCAAVEALVSRNRKPDTVELVAHEVDEDLIAPLRAVLDHLAVWCRARSVTLAVRIEATNFIMAHAGALHSCGDGLPFGSGAEDFDIVVSNPPYFKTVSGQRPSGGLGDCGQRLELRCESSGAARSSRRERADRRALIRG